MCTPSTPAHVKTLLDELLCPMDPLSEAVSLVPCAHKIQQTAAERIFGATSHGWMVHTHQPCPVCRTSVVGYIVDHSTRSIVTQLCELPEKQLHAMLAIMKENLAAKSMSVAKDVLVTLPYPGKPARFIHQEGDWDVYTSGAPLCRYMQFISATEGSLLTNFAICGYRNNKVVLSINFSKDVTEDLEKYLKNFDLILDKADQITGRFQSKTQHNLRQIFNIITENNEIPATYFEKIRDIVAKGTC